MKTEHNGLKGWEYFKKLLEEKSDHPISSQMKTEQEVREAIKDFDMKFVVESDEPIVGKGWHKVTEEGLPNKLGLYLVKCSYIYQVAVYQSLGVFEVIVPYFGAMGKANVTKEVVAWQKIEPYEEVTKNSL